ncbi:MAG: conjugal transfer protein TraG N-terminal domain-containing protein, partial [Geminicoccaceae bacterium]
GVANQAQPGSDFYESWSEYIKTCTIRGIEIGQLSKDDLFRSPDFISALNFDNTFFHAQIQVGATPESLPCSEAYDQLETYTQAFFLPSFKENVLPGVLDLEQPAGAAEVEDVINEALNGLGVGPAPQPVPGALVGQPITADDYITSSVLVPIWYYAVRKYYVQDGRFSYADQLDDSVRARNSQWMANQSLFDRYLRPMLTFVEGFMFAATPILALLIPVGAAGIGAAGRFILVGAWIQLWMPALAIVNLFIHNVVAGKMAALADAGTPLTSLAGLHQGDDIIQTWLGTGGLMASAVPVLTLMIVYGGAISANFFATRLQGEDVVMERQAAGATFNPYPQMQIDPARTFDRTAGSILQTGAAGRLATYHWNESLGNATESALSAHETATEQFESRLQQSVGNTWSSQESATVGQGFSQRAAAEGGHIDTAVEQSFGDVSRMISGETQLSKQEAKGFVTRAALNASFGAKIPLLGSLGGDTSSDLSSSEGRGLNAAQLERYTSQIEDKISDSAEVRAAITEAAAADIHGNQSDAYFSATNLGKDEALSQSAQDVLSTGQSYNETVRAGSSLSADRHVNAKDMIPAIARSDEASQELSELIMQNRLGGEAALHHQMMGARNEESFGDPELARLYAMTEVATSHLGDGDERSERIAAGLADVFSSAEGFIAKGGDAGANHGLADGGPVIGGIQPAVEKGLRAGLPGVENFNREQAVVEEYISDGIDHVPVAHQEQSAAVDEANKENMNTHNDRSLAVQNLRDKVLDNVGTPVLDAPRNIKNLAE